MEELELWKPVEGYENVYEISSFGRVKSFPRRGSPGTKIVNPFVTTTGYLKFQLYKNCVRDTRRVHQLVALAFIPNPENKPFVNHKDGNKQNNNVRNLEWCTHSENILHSYKTGLNNPQKRIPYQAGQSKIKTVKRLLQEGMRVCDIARQEGITLAIVGSVKAGKSWGWLQVD